MDSHRLELFWEKVDLDGPPPPDPWAPIKTGCWLWLGALNRRQGRFWTGAKYPNGHNKLSLAHRVAYELLVGPIPDGLTIDHLCRVPHCVNPEHMEPVPQGVNTLRSNAMSGVNSRRTICRKGLHPLSGENLGYASTGERRCKACYREKYRRNNKARWAREKAKREAELTGKAGELVE